jgi:hypothetical protein
LLNEEENRVYGDVDGKVGESATEEEFNTLNERTKDVLVEFLGNEPHALYTASSYDFKKISFGFVFKNRKTTPSDNKRWIQHIAKELEFPEGVKLDAGVYNKNQKIRCLGSSKDGEKRPKVLLVGEPEDTLITLIDGCEAMKMPAESKKGKEKKKTKNKDIEEPTEKALMERLVMNIPNTQDTDWDQWYKVAQVIFNEDLGEELFFRWSALSPKHDDRVARQLWAGLKKGGGESLSAGSIHYWSSANYQAYEQILLECLPYNSYQRRKLEFEKEHFKLMNPPAFVRHTDTIQILKDGDLKLLYQNIYFTKKARGKNGEIIKDENGDEIEETCSFIAAWKADVYIRTYQNLVFKPKLAVPKTEFNIFTDFPCSAIEGDCSLMKELMWLLSGEDAEAMEYLECYFAHMLQKPYEKPEVAVCFYTDKQGAGKDFTVNLLGKMIGGEYYYKTSKPENDVFGRFTEHLQKTILLKMEEAQFETNKKNETALMSMITSQMESYEGKGQKPITLDDYKRIVMTTNKHGAVAVPESDRRFVLINSSERRVGDREFWNTAAEAVKTEVPVQAYYHYLLHKDISKFNPRNRPKTDFYKDVKLSQRPLAARFFQGVIEDTQGDNVCWKARDLWTEMNRLSKFEITETAFGLMMKKFAPVLVKGKGRASNTYSFTCEDMRNLLQEKGWWVEL